MRLIDADKLPYEDIESINGNTYMCVNAYDIEHAPTIEQSEDCISREDAIRLAEQGQIQGYEWQFKKLCDLPSVTPQQKWIPVSEGLPEEDGMYLISTCMNCIDTCLFYKDDDEYLWVDYEDSVIAWMPLPPSYQGGSEE